MAQRALLIDRDGTVWNAHSWELRRLHGAFCSDQTFGEFLVRNLGYIRFQQSDDVVAIRVSPTRFSFQAYAAVCELLAGQTFRRISLAWFDGQWHHAIFPEPQPALKQLQKLATSLQPARASLFLARQRTSQTLPVDSPLLSLLDVWRLSSRQLNIDDYPQVIDAKLGRKFVIAYREPDTSRLLFRRIGNGYQMYHSTWSEQLIGQRVEDQPDPKYARWVADCWREAMLIDEPTLADVDVIVDNPVSGGSRRIQYLRLTIPITESSGEQLLLSASVGDPSIDLRVEVH